MIPDRVPIMLHVSEPILWLETHDRNPEMHETLDRLVKAGRRGEAAAMLIAYIAATAPVRAKVGGWGAHSGWPWAVNVLAQSNASDVAIYRVSNMLCELTSTPETKD